MRKETRQTVAALIRAAGMESSEQAAVLSALDRAENKPRPDKLLTPREACTFAEVTRKTLRRWEVEGHLHPRRITKSRIRWSRNELEKFLMGEAAGV